MTMAVKNFYNKEGGHLLNIGKGDQFKAIKYYFYEKLQQLFSVSAE